MFEFSIWTDLNSFLNLLNLLTVLMTFLRRFAAPVGFEVLNILILFLMQTNT